MEQTYFVMKPQKRGWLKYAAAGLLAATPFALLNGFGAGACVFIAIAGLCSLVKNHTIVVFDNSMTEKDFRGRFIRKVTADQITLYRKNHFDEIILIDFDSKPLLCIESNMTNRDRFEQWLTAHNIESK